MGTPRCLSDSFYTAFHLPNLMYVGCIVTVSLNDDFGKWGTREPRDSELKNVYLCMTELQYITECCCHGLAKNKCQAGILPFMSPNVTIRHLFVTATPGSLSQTKHVRVCESVSVRTVHVHCEKQHEQKSQSRRKSRAGTNSKEQRR